MGPDVDLSFSARPAQVERFLIVGSASLNSFRLK